MSRAGSSGVDVMPDGTAGSIPDVGPRPPDLGRRNLADGITSVMGRAVASSTTSSYVPYSALPGGAFPRPERVLSRKPWGLTMDELRGQRCRLKTRSNALGAALLGWRRVGSFLSRRCRALGRACRSLVGRPPGRDAPGPGGRPGQPAGISICGQRRPADLPRWCAAMPRHRRGPRGWSTGTRASVLTRVGDRPIPSAILGTQNGKADPALRR